MKNENNEANVPSVQVASIRARADRQIGRHQRLIEYATTALGRPRTIYLVLTGVTLWIAGNIALTRVPGAHIPDWPSFVWLQGTVALAALLMTLLILITQNRQARDAEARDHLDLEVNLLAEQKVTKLIALLEELRHDLPMIKDRVDAEADAMKQAVDPHAVLTALQEPLAGPSDPNEANASPKPP